MHFTVIYNDLLQQQRTNMWARKDLNDVTLKTYDPDIPDMVNTVQKATCFLFPVVEKLIPAPCKSQEPCKALP